MTDLAARVKELEIENAGLRGSLDELRLELWAAESRLEDTDGEPDVVALAFQPHLGVDALYAGPEGAPVLVMKATGSPLTVADILALLPSAQ